ncbi:M20/M25/M40 family metallo-hydrolase [Microbacterium invictum]|uniref:M20/M25/M40 family metallo-hydrolase n=1 Tax=Microbacterium invictum TaxID=515415 RepID=A0ABZ0VCC3_9MICO|nr:M20/M25/M40 family metallo-hydrolase [Microbacterium invictum]WQB71129.1 M20/M25/M40 family metallo-hydrolase [Microbacterium invictum]
MLFRTDAAASASAEALRAHADDQLSQYRHELAHLVGIDSGSYSPDGVDAVGAWCAARLAAAGFAVETPPTPVVDGRRFGRVVVGRRLGTGTRRILLFAHMDTVFADGTAALRPYREVGGRAYGPGVSDDKGGLLAGIHAADVLDRIGYAGYGELILAFTPDEEVGAPASGELLRAAATGVDAALCLECARENGDVVVARKGVADVHVDVSGRAAHAGVEPERGADAAVEAARLLLDAHALACDGDVTVNIGVVAAGERPNIVPAVATLRGEVRAWTAAALERTLHALERRVEATTVPGVGATFRREALCPPLEATDTAVLFQAARAVAADGGWPLGGAATGGVSDANFIAALGVPVLDGLGPIGGDDHSPTEWLDLASVPERVALLAGLVVRIAEG